VLAEVDSGKIDVLLVVGDPLDPEDTAPVRTEHRAKLRDVLFVGPLVSGAALEASILLPTSSWSEEDGTLVSFEGRIQAVRRCHPPRGEGRPGWKTAAEIADAAGGERLPAWTAAEEVYRTLAGSVEAFRGVDPADIGLLGVAAKTPAAGAAR